MADYLLGYTPILFISAFMTLVIAKMDRTYVCPENVVTAVFDCLAPLRGPDANQLVTAGEYLDAVKARCRDGSFQRAVKCVEILLHLCRHSHQLPLLHDLTDVMRMERSFGYLCENINLYAEHKDCLVKEDTTIQNCMLMNSNNFYHDPSVSMNRANEVEQICRFLTETTKCIEQPVRYYCDGHLADVLVKFMDGVTPPKCNPYSASNKVTFSLTLITISGFYLVAYR